MPALSVTVNVAERLPTAAGSNVIAILQLDAAARLLPQLLVVAKSVAFVPPIAILAIVKADEPELLKVTVFDVLVLPTF